jgi:glycosyltransferase involved in cell wall biosynthesis
MSNFAKRPLVSIGVPTFNRPKTLERALHSLVNQTYDNLEIVVSDNCSSLEEVTTVLDKYAKDPRVKFYRQPTNIGSIENFNFLLEKLRGDYCMRMGDDDWIDLNYIEECVKFLIQNPHYVGVYGRTRLYDQKEEFVKYDPELSVDHDSYFERITFYYQHVTQNGMYFSLFDRALLENLKAKRLLADDWLGIARIAFRGKIKMLQNTNLNLSLGGAGSSIDSLVLSFSKFTKYFPFSSVAINAALDIVFESQVYRKIGFYKRIRLAKACVKTIYQRFNVKNEIKNGYKGFLKSSFSLA